MKKLYAVLALASFAVSAFASEPLEVFTDASIFKTSAEDVEAARKAPVKKLNFTKLEVSAENTSVSDRLNVPSLDGWKNLGKCTWYEDLFTIFSDIPAGESWEVDIEENNATPGYYRILPYSVDSSVSTAMKAKDTQNYIYIDATNPAKVVVEGPFVPYGAYSFSHLNSENGYSAYGYYGYLEDNVITFAAKTFLITFPDGRSTQTNNNGDFAIVLPGGVKKDYTLNVSPTSLCENPGAYFETVGEDIAAIRIVALDDYFMGSPANFDLVAQIGQEFNISSNVVLRPNPSGRGISTLLISAVNSNGRCVNGTAVYFVGADDDDTWKDAGSAVYNEVVLCSEWADVDEEEVTVNVEESATTPGLYRLVDPYAKHYKFGSVAASDHSHGHYIYINATDPDKVYIEPSVLGLNFPNYGEPYLWSWAHFYILNDMEDEAVKEGLFGKMTDNVITMPQGAITMGYSLDANGEFYTASNTGEFKITLSDNAGVDNISVADKNAPVEYFNLQGVRISNPENGIYIRRQGQSVSKISVK